MPRKKLAIFCDGTWNDLRMTDRTNVSLLAQCVSPAATDGTPQIVFYDEGVGVGTGTSRVSDKLIRVLGGAFGRGIDNKLELAYRFIVLNYEPGDDIYIFGFSRGAYMARSLCGLIRKCGILRRDCFERTPEAIERYRNAMHPRDPDMIDYRSRHTHELAAGEEDHLRLSMPALEERDHPTFGDRLEDLYQFRPARTYRMMYLGIWDTVGSLGVPNNVPLLGGLLNRKYRFHDTHASTLVSSLRHAVAIDEDRVVFGSTGVDNIYDLNLNWARHTGWDVNDRSSPHYVPYPWRPYQQLWFPGDHGAVGGGNPEAGLSSIALAWIAEGAVRAGLHLDFGPATELGRAKGFNNCCAEWRIRKDGSVKKPGEKDGLGRIGGYQMRKGPVRVEEVAPAALERWERLAAYRPANLSVVAGLPFVSTWPFELPPPGFPAFATPAGPPASRRPP